MPAGPAIPQAFCPNSKEHEAHNWLYQNDSLDSLTLISCPGIDLTYPPPASQHAVMGLHAELADGRAPEILVLRVAKILDQAQAHFERRNADYRDKDGFEPSEVLGVQGQFAEIWRKVWKLKNALWDGREMTGEDAEEILMDYIGHCALAIDMLRRNAHED